MTPGLIVTGFPRSGTTLLYCMLRYTLDGYQFRDREHDQLLPGVVTKSPRAVFRLTPEEAPRAIVMVRDPRAILTSVHSGEGFVRRGYFISAHSCLSDADRGLCEWWQAIKNLQAQGAWLMCYEFLVAVPQVVQRTLQEWLGLRYLDDRRFEDFHRLGYGEYWERAMNGRRALQAREWDTPEHRARIEEQFAAHPELHQVMEEMGYNHAAVGRTAPHVKD